MERLNGTIRDHEKNFRGLGTADTPVFDGMKVHYNHVRRHDSIKQTLAEAAGISTEGANKWKTLIQNSSLYLIATDQRMRSYHHNSGDFREDREPCLEPTRRIGNRT